MKLNLEEKVAKKIDSKDDDALSQSTEQVNLQLILPSINLELFDS